MEQLTLNDTLIFLDDISFSPIINFIKSSNPDNIFIIVDENTNEYCLPILLKHAPVLKTSFVINIKPGEVSKSIEEVQNISSHLINKNITRNSLIINLGGGVICDLGGFIAAIIKRGVKFINIPTTLMSQIDAAIGGKVAVNFENHKNQLGLFNNPKLIFIYTPFLKSLLNNHLISAQAEVFKYGLIFDELLWKKMKSKPFHKKLNFKNLILECLKIKIQIVSSDYYDHNNRRKLNFGHSISHVVESWFLLNNSPISHGLALSVGLICETYISQKIFKFSSQKLHDVSTKILNVFSPVELDKKLDHIILKYLKYDKKFEDGLYNFTLIKDLGDSVINCTVLDAEIINSLDYYRKICQI